MEADPAAVTLEAFRPHEIEGPQLEALAAIENAVGAEQRPGDPPRSAEHFRRFYQGIAAVSDIDRRSWWAVAEGLPVGYASGETRTTGDNPRAMFIEIKVVPAWRRRGVGTRLLGALVGSARERERDLLMGWVQGPEPLDDLPGTAFGRAVGAEPRREEHLNRLQLDEVDPALLAAWLEQGPRRSPDIELVWRDDGFPDDELEGIAAVMQDTSAGEPTDDLDVEPMRFTAVSVREWMDLFNREGRAASVGLLRHLPTGRFVGYTMLTADPANPRVFDQFGTGVLPEFRRRGLGRWLKAAMLERMTARHPGRREIRTGNADSNAAMLAINRAMGFRPWVASATWQGATDEVARYLRATS